MPKPKLEVNLCVQSELFLDHNASQTNKLISHNNKFDSQQVRIYSYLIVDPPPQFIDDISADDFKRTFDINVTSYFLMSKVREVR